MVVALLAAGFRGWRDARVRVVTVLISPLTYGIITDSGLRYRLLVAKREWDFKTKANSIYSKIHEVSVVESIPVDDLRVLTVL